MRNLAIYLVCLAALLALASCSGSSAPAGPVDIVDDLPELEFDLVTDPGSTVSANEVDGEMQDVDDTLNARIPSGIRFHKGYQGIQGMYFTPPTPPGGGFSGQMTLQVSMDTPAENEYDGVRLFLFYIDPATHEPISLDSARAHGNWVTFDVNALGHLVIAENLSIPRPNTTFTVSAFADMAITTTGTPINFWAIAQSGFEPYSYSWDYDDGNAGSGINATHAYTAAGTYVVTVTATDASGETAFASSTPIEISATAIPLTDVVVSLTRDADNFFLYTYSASISGGKAPYTFSWDFTGDGTEDSTVPSPVNFEFATKGVYNGTLVVTDNNGDTVQGNFTTTVVLPPPVIASLDKTTVVIGDNVSIDGLYFDTQDITDGVWVGPVKQQIVSWLDTVIVFTVVSGTQDGPVFVRKEEDSNSLELKVIPRSPDEPGGGQI